jgi:drug/metabolite transporter (DMT)-like permease
MRGVERMAVRDRPATEALAPPAQDLGLLGFALIGASIAPALIAATVAPALAVAFWRNLLSLPVVGGVAVVRREWPRLRGRALALALLGGAFLGAHFAAFTPSLRYTSVASASALVCSQAIWAGVFGRLLGERLPRRAWLGVGIALTGVLLITGVDFSVSGRALTGDGLALLGGMLGGAYLVTGGFARRALPTAAYTSAAYSTATVVLLAICLATGQALAGYSADDWVQIAALMVAGQLVGHTTFNLVLRSLSPTLVSLATLFTVPGAALIAAAALGQTPPLEAIPALALLLAGTAVFISAGRANARDATRP